MPLTPRAEAVGRKIRAEFLESPGLRLTRWQIQQLWNLDVEQCRTVVRQLVDVRFLREARDGTFVRPDA